MPVVDIKEKAKQETLLFVQSLNTQSYIEKLIKRFIDMSNKGILIKSHKYDAMQDFESSLDTQFKRYGLSNEFFDLYQGNDSRLDLKRIRAKKTLISEEKKLIDEELTKLKVIQRDIDTLSDNYGDIHGDKKAFVNKLLESNTTLLKDNKENLEVKMKILDRMASLTPSLDGRIYSYEEKIQQLIIKKFFHSIQSSLREMFNNNSLHIRYDIKLIRRQIHELMNRKKFYSYKEKSFSPFVQRLLGFLFNHMSSYSFDVLVPTNSLLLKLRFQDGKVYLDVALIDGSAKQEFQLVEKELETIYLEHEGLIYLIASMSSILRKSPLMKDDIRVLYWKFILKEFPTLDANRFVELISKQYQLSQSVKKDVWNGKQELILKHFPINFVEQEVDTDWKTIKDFLPDYYDENTPKTTTVLVGVMNDDYIFQIG